MSGGSLLAPAPAAVAVPDGEPRERVLGALAGVDWAALDWPELLDRLAALGRADAVLGRLGEGHVDALRILRQAGAEPVPGALYGVWASRSRGGGLKATAVEGGWTLEGTLPFASGVGIADRALVTALVHDGQVLLDCAVDDWEVADDGWYTSAMAGSRSWALRPSAARVPDADVVGGRDFYLDRPWFLPGGVGVAAVWWGAAVRVHDLTVPQVQRAADPPQVSAVLLGRMRTELAAAGSALQVAGRLFDGAERSGELDVAALQRLSTETRAVVADAVHRLLDSARQLAGPAGLARDAAWGPSIEDLDLYVRQQHHYRDAESLGRAEDPR